MPTPPSTPKPTATAVSLRERAAQLLLVGFRGTDLQQDDPLLTAIGQGLGGVVLFDRDQQTGGARNIQSPAQLMALTATLRKAAGDRTLLIAVDQEGGKVARLGPQNGFPQTPSEADVGATGDPGHARSVGAATGSTLAGAGINLNLAPVVDLNVNPDNPSIGALGRSFSADVNVVVEMASAVIAGLHESAVLATLKHFPGLGSATGDTDHEFVDVSATWTRRELQPFAQLIANGTPDVVMVANALNGQLDAQFPSTLSAATVAVLRQQLGWDGVIVTDDLQAGALRDSYAPSEIVRLALAAGSDLLLFANQQVYEPDVLASTLDTIEELVANGKISEEQIDASVARLEQLSRRAP
jgi:beta-N-acetylhexosaminidase